MICIFDVFSEATICITRKLFRLAKMEGSGVRQKQNQENL